MQGAACDVHRNKYSRRAACTVRRSLRAHDTPDKCTSSTDEGASVPTVLRTARTMSLIGNYCADGANKGHCGQAAARTGTSSADWGTAHACDWRSGYSPCRLRRVSDAHIAAVRVILYATIFSVLVRSAARQANGPMRCRDNTLASVRQTLPSPQE
jgi:hypothetical protein